MEHRRDKAGDCLESMLYKDWFSALEAFMQGRKEESWHEAI